MNKKHLPLKKYAFTLIELVFVAMIIALIMPEMFSLYNFIIRSNKEIIARQQAIQQWYEFFERLNLLMEDYTVDYEEYFNRQMVWCVTSWSTYNWRNFKRNVWKEWHCTNFTAYGNENSHTSTQYSWYNNIYYCSSLRGLNTDGGRTMILKDNMCWEPQNTDINKHKQSYGQYAALFKDVKGWDWNIVWSEDDEELWYLINTSSIKINNKDKFIDAIEDSDNIQELYLISHDWKKRLYFRRKLDKEDWYKQYKIQILRLRWFDAWSKHDFDDISDDNKWIYDGVIDTWACDTSMWFVWEGNDIGWAYTDYHLPKDENDCRLNFSYWSTDLSAWRISISPRWDADLYRAKEDRQINTYMKIFILNKVYFPSIVGSNSRIASTITNFEVPLETVINMKDFYRTTL